MGILKHVFLEREEWWHLVPDAAILMEGGQTEGTILNLAARHKDGEWLMVYLGKPASFAIDMRKIAGADRAIAFWIDPRTGESSPIGEFSTNGVQRFTTSEGWEDALLIVEPVRDRGAETNASV